MTSVLCGELNPRAQEYPHRDDRCDLPKGHEGEHSYPAARGKAPCPDCGGEASEFIKFCATCDGIGLVAVDGPAGVPHTDPCPDCGGSGTCWTTGYAKAWGKRGDVGPYPKPCPTCQAPDEGKAP